MTSDVAWTSAEGGAKGLLRKGASALLHLYPFSSGCTRIANTAPLVWLAQRGRAVARLRAGAALCVRIDDFNGRAAYYFGDSDPKLTWVFRRVLRPGDTVLDVGANWGIITLTCAALVGPTGAVHAFEPQPELATALERSVALNGFRHVRVHAVALSTDDGEADLAVPGGHTGAGSFHSLAEWERDRAAATVKVKLRRGGSLLATLGLSHVRLMKIDVEGHEEKVLTGCGDLFDRTPPDVVVFEQNRGAVPFWDRPEVRFLRDRRYRLAAVAPVLLRPRVVALEPGGPLAPGHDFVAIHDRPENRPVLAALGLR